MIERAVLLRRTVGSTASWLAELDASAPRPAAPVGTLSELRERFERDVLISVLRRCDGDLDAVARELAITRRSVYNLLKCHRISAGK